MNSLIYGSEPKMGGGGGRVQSGGVQRRRAKLHLETFERNVTVPQITELQLVSL